MSASTQQARRELGARLRQVRLEQGLTLEQLAGRLEFFGRKGTFSEYENGKRVVPVAVLQAYATHFGLDDKALLRLRAEALARPPADAPFETAQEPPPAEAELPPSSRGRRRPAAALAVVLTVVVLVAGWRVHAGAAVPLHASITVPRLTAPAVGGVHGTVGGLRAGDQLWLAIQVDGEHRWHPTETPCVVTGRAWTFPALYLGRPEDRGKKFRIVLVATSQGSAGQQALIDYAQRPKDTGDTYLGMPSLPAQARVLAETDIVRG